MPQFFIDKPLAIGRQFEITGKDAHHIKDVLRLKAGNWFVISDGKGNSYRAEIISLKSQGVGIIVKEKIERKAISISPALAFSIIKHDRSEWIIQKAVELGCKHIIPFYSLRTIPKYATADKKHLRWEKIALEAAKQSGAPIIPQVSSPIDFGELCGLIPKYENAILFWEGEHEAGLPHLSSPYKGEVLLIIGPEGGFDESEIIKAREAGARTVSLGRQILRVETAAITALGIVQYELGNLG